MKWEVNGIKIKIRCRTKINTHWINKQVILVVATLWITNQIIVVIIPNLKIVICIIQEIIIYKTLVDRKLVALHQQHRYSLSYLVKLKVISSLWNLEILLNKCLKVQFNKIHILFLKNQLNLKLILHKPHSNITQVHNKLLFKNKQAVVCYPLKFFKTINNQFSNRILSKLQQSIPSKLINHSINNQDKMQLHNKRSLKLIYNHNLLNQLILCHRVQHPNKLSKIHNLLVNLNCNNQEIMSSKLKTLCNNQLRLKLINNLTFSLNLNRYNQFYNSRILGASRIINSKISPWWIIVNSPFWWTINNPKLWTIKYKISRRVWTIINNPKLWTINNKIRRRVRTIISPRWWTVNNTIRWIINSLFSQSHSNKCRETLSKTVCSNQHSHLFNLSKILNLLTNLNSNNRHKHM